MTAEGRKPRTATLRDLSAEPTEPVTALAIWSPEQLQIVKDLICPGASDEELKLFALHCRRTGLDPFSRQTYGIVRYRNEQKADGSWHRVPKLTIQNAIDGLRLIAERTGKYGGQLGPLWCGPDGKWTDVWLKDGYPSAAKVAVIRTDWKEPLWSTARWGTYVQQVYDRKERVWKVTDMWDRMPDLMLGKVAESLSLRRAFPQELSGVYGEEEMAQADRRSFLIEHDIPADPPPSGQGQVIDGRATPVDPPVDRPDPPAPKVGPKTREWYTRNWMNGIAKAQALGVDPVPDPLDPMAASKVELEESLEYLVGLIEEAELRAETTIAGTMRDAEATAQSVEGGGGAEEEVEDDDPDAPW